MSTRQLHTFDLLVNDTTQRCYQAVRTQISIHPHETPELSITRVLAFAHCLNFSPTLSDDCLEEKNPTIYARESSGEYTLWAHVGELNKKTLKVIQHSSTPRVRFYFFTEAQIEIFCHLMRGSKRDWVSQYEFFAFDFALIKQITDEPLKRRNAIEVAFLDDVTYVTREKDCVQGSFVQLNMWKKYQESLMIEMSRKAPFKETMRGASVG